MGRGTNIEIGTDASPFGMGGWMSVDGRITRFYFCAVSAEDVELFQLEHGSCDGQQILESLAILIAIRLWVPSSGKRVQLAVRADSVGALILILKMRPRTSRQAIIARELALELAHFSFPPSVVHTPGIAHVVADGLSRISHPKAADPKKILSHPALANAEYSCPPTRGRDFYKALQAMPISHSMVDGD